MHRAKSRTRAFAVMVWTLASIALLPARLPARTPDAGPDDDGESAPRLMTGSQIVEGLRSERRMNICFVRAATEPAMQCSLAMPIDDLLAQLTSEGGYRQRTVHARLVIYPADSAMEHVVRPPAADFTDRPRFHAASAYVKWLRENVPGFENLLQPAYIGAVMGRPAQEEHISLSPEAPVVEHFVELLGSNPHRVFTIGPGPSGLPMLSFRIIRWDDGTAAFREPVWSTPPIPQLCGRVLDLRTSKPIANACVVVWRDTEVPRDTARTDSAGVFRVGWVPRFGLQVVAPGYNELRIPLGEAATTRSARDCCDLETDVALRRTSDRRKGPQPSTLRPPPEAGPCR